MVANEGLGPAAESTFAIEESVVEIEESKTHESSIAEWTLALLPGSRRRPQPAKGGTPLPPSVSALIA